MKINYKEYIYTSSVKEEVIIVKGTVFAKDKKDAIYQAQRETSLSGYVPNEVTIKFIQILPRFDLNPLPYGLSYCDYVD